LGVHDYIVRSEFQLDAKDESYGGALTVDYKAPVALTSITGYRHVHTTLPFDFDGSTEYTGNVHNMRTTQSVLSEELRASGKAMDDSLRWLGGAYVFTETD
jgi:iron complex outermembrane receptor protein